MSAVKKQIPGSIWSIGIASFLLNLSSAIVFSLSGVYMKNVLNVDIQLISSLEGLVEGFSYAIKLFSGVFSDFLKKRKRIMVFGFFLVTISRPLLALSTTIILVLLARLCDRFGNGIQATPRDALIGDLSPPVIKGSCYGLRQSLASAGSFFAGIVGTMAMVLTGKNYALVFLLATIPAAFALFLLITTVKDAPETKNADKQPFHWKDIRFLGRSYWILMGIAGLFMLSRVGEAMLILHAHGNFGLQQEFTPYVLMLYNGANALASYPIGKISDRFDRKTLLAFGFFMLILSDLLLGYAGSFYIMLTGVACWGVQIGVTQSMFTAIIADIVPKKLRGTGFGFFYLVSSVSLTLAGIMGGKIAHHWSIFESFKASAVIAFIAFSLLLFVKTKGTLKPKNV